MINGRLFFLTSLFFVFINVFCYSQDYSKSIHTIISNYSQELASKKGLFLAGSGGAMMHDIQEITVDYLSFEALEVNEARKLYVEIVEEYLKRINKNKKIIPHLHNYPFEFRNLNLMISFEDLSRRRRGDGLVALIFLCHNNEIVYESYNHEKGCFYKLHREPYNEALKIVNNRFSQETNPLDSSQNSDFCLHSNE